jgi:hypothetical protein
VLLLGSGAALAGCSTTGPLSVRTDRFNYNKAAAHSANEQFLLNILRLRYGEPIYWVEIGSMLSQYTFQAGADISAWEYDINRWANPELRAAFGVRPDPAPTGRWGANVGWTDRPTITYTPLQGADFAERVMAPVPAATIIYLSQSGWPIDLILECCVQRLHNFQNRPIHDVSAGNWIADVKFRTLSGLLRKIQDAGHLNFALEYDAGRQSTYLYPTQRTAGVEQEVQDLRELLGMPDEVVRVQILDGGVRRRPDQVVMQTRSLLGTMFALAQSFDPPAEHVQSGEVQVVETEQEADSGAAWLRIEHSRVPVSNALVQVYYRGHWFYVPRDEWRSKRTFALLTYLFSLKAATDTGQRGPLVTVGTGS